MIISKIIGGLGNQMFQYSFGRSLSLDLDQELGLDLNSYKVQFGLTPRNYELDIFNHAGRISTFQEIRRLIGNDYINKIVNRLLGVDLKIRKKQYFREKSDHSFVAIDVSRFKDGVYLEGFWNSERYFIDHEKEIRNDFLFKKKLSGANKEIALDMGKNDSISIHVRRGDYVSSEATNKFHGTCGLDYYKKAVDLINKRVKNPKYFVFSDDMEWVKENLKIRSAVYVEGNIGDKSYIDMQLMSLCKHNIIANSSFSWWGAWLNSNAKKIVVAPKKWFNDTSVDTTDLVPEGWIRL